MSKNNPTTSSHHDAAIKVAVLSDDALLRAALSSVLEQGDVEMTAIESAEVALWDPGADVGRVEQKLSELAKLPTPTVALLPDASQAQRAIAAGARGVILRDRVGPHLVSALRAVRGGLTVLDPALADELLPSRALREDVPVEDLTVREREVVQLMAEGLSNKLIAKRLDISGHTAKFHIGRILGKLDADTRTEAVVRALRHGLVSL